MGCDCGGATRGRSKGESGKRLRSRPSSKEPSFVVLLLAQLARRKAPRSPEKPDRPLPCYEERRCRKEARRQHQTVAQAPHDAPVVRNGAPMEVASWRTSCGARMVSCSASTVATRRKGLGAAPLKLMLSVDNPLKGMNLSKRMAASLKCAADSSSDPLRRNVPCDSSVDAGVSTLSDIGIWERSCQPVA
jgi:hypothetical protein